MDALFDRLHIPDSCKIGKRLTKKQFLENFRLNSSEKKILTNDVESITLEYFLSKHTINIAPYSDEERDYSEVAFVKVEISNPSKLKQIATIIQNIPHLLIVFFIHEQRCAVNMAPKRINKADSTKLVVEKAYFTEWIDLENTTPQQMAFLDTLAIEHHPFTDFYAFYNSYLDKIITFNATKYTGTLRPEGISRELLDEIEKLEAEIQELKGKIRKEVNFNDRVRLNIVLKKATDRMNVLKEEL
jgi:hypothetical protein